MHICDMLSIGFLTPEYPHPELSRSGGLGTSIKNLATGLVSYEHNATIFVVGQDKECHFFDEGVKIVSIKKEIHFAFNWYLERKRIQRIIQRYIDAEEIQLIEAPDWTGIPAFMKFDIPLIIRLNGSDGYFCYLDGRKQKWKHHFLEGKALKSADYIVSVSTFTADLTKKIFKLNSSIETIHNGVDVDVFKPIETDINEGQLLYYGTIIRKKGVLELAKAFNLVVQKAPTTTLLLIGKDAVDVFDKISTLDIFFSILSEQAKKQVSYLAEVPYKEIQIYIAKAHIVVLPSFAEAFPMTWLETLAMGKALISSDIGWTEELMVDGKTGYTVNPKNHNEFSEKILKLLGDLELCEAFGKSGRDHVADNFSSKIITEQNLKYYKSIILK